MVARGVLKTFLNPLSATEEKRVLEALQKGEQGAKDRLILHNMRLVAHVAKKYYNESDDIEDLISIGTIGLLKAVDTFDSTKGNKLATYAARCIDNELLMYFRGKRKQAKDVSIYEPIGMDKEGNQISLMDVLEEDTKDVIEQMECQSNLNKLRELIPKVLPKRERQIIAMRYGLVTGEPCTQREVAKKLGISRSYVSRIEKRAVERLRIYFSIN